MGLPVHESWQPVLAGVEKQIHDLGDFLRAEPAFLPRGNDILRAFQDPFDEVKVLIVGQDPYPTPGHAMGLSFSTNPGVRPLPRSLANIYRELHTDLGLPVAEDGDLTPWARQGVLLLNRVLTVRPGKPASHRGKGWEAVTEAAIRALAERDAPLVAILWGRDAQTAARFLGDTPRIESPHPSPLSASRGFFGSRPFSRANELLVSAGAEPVDWRL
ncbi:MAG: uracil-DNA glycosylase [Corynebacterium humireducens]|jgi:uracil-DNA glycosylase|uniref:Uracil-DNA glycosylase n=2 Tax=Corynebacterium humireducens TaxID=1223514 RepID=A0A0B5DBA0_9CORY|nr:uracil-DNA glycosylase [Corynebacterium humireducens]AJE33029.1 uracil-DNA glycosylase [Corynebacterium humireducens NBRC 106098 = DSM 45392]NLA56837.1 uracil-DNA glycosylase [Corynebacterium humireducens]